MRDFKLNIRKKDNDDNRGDSTEQDIQRAREIQNRLRNSSAAEQEPLKAAPPQI